MAFVIQEWLSCTLAPSPVLSNASVHKRGWGRNCGILWYVDGNYPDALIPLGKEELWSSFVLPQDTYYLTVYFIIVLFQCRWFCHFDDDVYVNVGELVSVLDRYNPSSEPVYLGRWPLSREKMEVCREELYWVGFFTHRVQIGNLQYLMGSV